MPEELRRFEALHHPKLRLGVLGQLRAIDVLQPPRSAEDLQSERLAGGEQLGRDEHEHPSVGSHMPLPLDPFAVLPEELEGLGRH